MRYATFAPKSRFNDAKSAISQPMKVSCMQFINALLTSPEDLDFRIHLRNEFLRCGLKQILPHLKEKENDELDIQLKVFDENREDDLLELSHRLRDIRAEMEYPSDNTGNMRNAPPEYRKYEKCSIICTEYRKYEKCSIICTEYRKYEKCSIICTEYRKYEKCSIMLQNTGNMRNAP
ncbi:unnamed protein product [Ranitomeya imitator]|uniref:Formin FH3 domain-containing protein n=1 Tax=Ranitomeya imitator TaxID=111125 RepID=A0ABN9MT26_9NEOB|nr:unnamed protein product [Ranitomeya imitator]